MKKVKVKAAKKQLADKNIINMFNQMLGTEDADPAIVIPKYKMIRTKVKSLSKILSAATEDVLRKSFPDEKNGCDDIMTYVESLNTIEFMEVTCTDNLTPAVAKELCEAYTILKDNNNIKVIVLTCKNLIEYSGKLDVGETFDDSFIARIPGFEFSPFPFSKLNIKQIWVSPQISDRIKKYIFTVMKIVLDISKTVYKTLTSPDVDVKEFSKAIISSIAQVKKQIPRCDKAFAKIEQSVGLLEGNFDGYYKDFIQSQNPSTIIESFVIDVSQSGGGDAQTTRQFRKIINYYQKATHGKIKDPKIKKVFDMLNANFNVMEENANTHNKKHDDDDTTDINSDIKKNDKDEKLMSKSAKRRYKKRQKNEMIGKIKKNTLNTTTDVSSPSEKDHVPDTEDDETEVIAKSVEVNI
jgi:hypothetical protein